MVCIYTYHYNYTVDKKGIMIQHKEVYSFSQIPIIEHSLVVLDIDDTLLTFNGYNYWNPIKLDEIHLDRFIENCLKLHCILIVLTARPEWALKHTMRDLKKIGLNIQSKDVYFSEKKGDKLFEIVNLHYPTIQNILFVDDRLYNLLDVELAFQTLPHSYDLHLFLMNHLLIS